MTTKTIQSSGGDAATLHAFEALLAAANPISDPWIGSVNNEIITETTLTTFGSYGQTGTNTITIQPQTGEGFADLHDYTTAPLDFDASAGAGFTDGGAADTTLTITGTNITLQGLQWRLYQPYSSQIGLGGDQCRFLRNIVRNEGDSSILLASGTASAKAAVIANNCIIVTGFAANSIISASLDHGTGHWIANTIVMAHGSKVGAAAIEAIEGYYSGTANFYQNAFYVWDATSGAGFGKLSSSGIAGDYNVTNGLHGGEALSVGTAGGVPGANSSTSGNIANDVTTGDVHGSAATTAVDYRPKAGGLLLAFIPSGSRYTGSGLTSGIADTDIRGQTRVGVANDCGCFQKTVAAADTIMAQACL